MSSPLVQLIAQVPGKTVPSLLEPSRPKSLADRTHPPPLTRLVGGRVERLAAAIHHRPAGRFDQQQRRGQAVADVFQRRPQPQGHHSQTGRIDQARVGRALFDLSDG